MTLRRHLGLLRREARGTAGRLVFFVLCLAVGVAAVVAVAGLSSGLDAGLRREGRQLLAADLAVESRRPAPPELDEVLDRLGSELAAEGLRLQRAEIREMATVVAAGTGRASATGPSGPTSQLVELKAVAGPYPFYGELKLRPDRPLDELLDARTAVVAPDLLARLGLEVGDMLRIGGRDFRIAGTVLEEPDRVRFGLTLGPRVFVSLEGLERAALVRKGSRVEHKVLLQVERAGDRVAVGVDRATLERLASRLRAELPADFGVETWRDAQPSIRAGLRRLDRFLGLVALLSLLVGGVGIAQTVRSWLADRMGSIAILKCLGLRPREIAALYGGQTVLLGLAGSAVGLATGAAVLALLPGLFPQLIPRGLLVPWQPAAMGRGLGLGVGVALLFSAPPLLTVWRVPPARVLRRDAEPLPTHRGVLIGVAAVLAAGLLALAAAQSRSWGLGLRFTGGLVLVTAGLAAAARLLVALVGRVRGSGSSRPGRRSPLRHFALRSFALRHGLAALGRPGAGTLGAIVALGLGVLVVLTVAVVERQLSDQLTSNLPADAPSAFLVDIQPEQWPRVRELLLAEGAEDLDSVPVVTARLEALDGEDAQTLAERTRGRGAADAKGASRKEGGSERTGDPARNRTRARRWALTREQRLTYREELPADNRVIEGELWSLPDRAEVSVEEGYARDLGIGVGSVIRLDVQGVPLELTVTTLREVDWSTFRLNFFLLVEPGVLDAAPQQRVATVRLPESRLQEVQDRLAARFPNVTFLRVREIVERIVGLLEKLGLGVRFLGGFTVLAGLAILGGAVSAGSARRGREVALLKTLGVTRRGVAAVFAVEYALVGLVAGAVGAVAAGVLAREVLHRGLEIPWTFHPGPYAVAVVGCALLTVAAGLAASTRALRRRPLEVLRET